MPLNNITIIGDNCTGCGGCFNVCPKGAIELKEDGEGFLYPNVNANCINCGLCVKKCPVNGEGRKRECDFIQKGYVVLTKDRLNYLRSASGGVFTTIAKSFLSENGNAYVVGAVWDKEENKVIHWVSNTASDILRMANSKYVQSDMKDTYKRVNTLLQQGSKVLFSGTPCQVAALKSITGNPQNLITIDIICHGVPSPKFLSWQIQELNKQGKNTYDNVVFRWKNALWKHGNFYMVLQKTKTNRKIFNNASVPFYNLFMKNKTHRMSCYKCKFACLNREGDLTIGDCDSARLYSSFYSDYGKSSVLVNTEKGDKSWTDYEHLFVQCQLDIDAEARVNKPLLKPEDIPLERMTIYKDIEMLPYKSFLIKYGRKESYYKSLLYRLFDFLPFKYKVL